MIKKYITNINIDFYKKNILEKEKEIVKTYPSASSGGTGLGKNSLTSRFSFYNLLEWKCFKNLREDIKKFYIDYSDFYDQNEPIYVQCWANVLRNGEKMNLHSHCSDKHHTSYGGISGTLFVYGDIKTYTQYHFGDKNNIFILNEPGVMTLFPSNISHKVDEYTGNNERISIAFDIKTEKDWKINKFFYNKSNPFWISIK